MTNASEQRARAAAVKAATDEAKAWQVNSLSYTDGKTLWIIEPAKGLLPLEGAVTAEDVPIYRFRDQDEASKWISKRCIDKALDAYLAALIGPVESDLEDAADVNAWALWEEVSGNEDADVAPVKAIERAYEMGKAAFLDPKPSAHAEKVEPAILETIARLTAQNAALQRIRSVSEEQRACMDGLLEENEQARVDVLRANETLDKILASMTALSELMVDEQGNYLRAQDRSAVYWAREEEFLQLWKATKP